MKSTQRFLSLVLCLVLCLAIFPASASAAGIVESGWANTARTAEFVLYSDGRLVISGTGTIDPMNQWSFSSFPNDYTSLADARLQTRSEVRTLIIGEGIGQVGASAFQECANLTAVNLPLSLTVIQNNAFQDCASLMGITIPSNVISIGNQAFLDCTGLTSVYLSDGLQTIGFQSFMNCTGLPDVTIPANVTTIGDQAFANCNSLKTIVFTGNLPVNIGPNVFQNVRANAYYPVDNDSWNQGLNPTATFPDYGGRLTWHASAAETSSDGWVQKNGFWYYYQNGVMVRDNWVAYEGFWFHFGENGRMQTGRQLIDGKYYYLDPVTGVRQSGLQADGKFYDDNGVWQPSYSGVNDGGLNMFRNGWQQSADGKWFYIKNKAKLKGWLKSGNYWYYLDPTTGAMVTGWLTWEGKTYYLRPADVAAADGFPEGSMIAGRTERIGDATTGQYYTFDSSGALKGGRVDNNPLGNLVDTGWRQGLDGNGNPGGGWNFYRSDGTKVSEGWELIGNGVGNGGSRWYYFDKGGTMKTGWLKWKDSWYWLTTTNGTGDPRTSTTGQMVTGFATIQTTPEGLAIPKTYFFKSNGALNGKGWIKTNNKWYYLANDGVVVTGWFRDKTKWYYLDPTSNPIGEMKSGYVTTLADGVTPIADPDGVVGPQSFNASGAWLGAGLVGGVGVDGRWSKENGAWYYYDANNNRVTGLQTINKKVYYLDPTSNPQGKMLTGVVTCNDGQKRYFNADGAMETGWKQLSGVWFYFDPNGGAMLYDWQKIKNRWYYLDPGTGAMQVGWIENPVGSGDWYFLDKDSGAMHGGGWMKLDSKWYYMNPVADGTYGKQIQGWVQDGGYTYYLQVSGNPAEGWMLTGGPYVIDGKTCIFDSSGHLISQT